MGVAGCIWCRCMGWADGQTDVDWYWRYIPPGIPASLFSRMDGRALAPVWAIKAVFSFGVGCPLGRWTGRAGGRMVGWGVLKMASSARMAFVDSICSANA